MMQQMNLFNTSPEVAGFKLDYLEVWNWGTFDQKVYCMNTQGNNSLLTGANASGKSTLIDALLTLLVPLKRQRFYNQSSGVEKKGNRTEESYFFGNYGNQQQEGAASTTTLRLRDKGARSVLLASFCNVDKRVVTLFQVRYYTGEELKVLFGIAREPLTIKRDFSEFDLHGDWRKRLTKKYNTNDTRRKIEFFDGPVAYGEKMIALFGMRSDKALTLFNQIVGVKVLDDLDSFIRMNMLEEVPAEEKYQELKNSKDPDDQELAKMLVPRRKYVVGGIVYSDEKGTKVDYEGKDKGVLIPRSVYQDIIDLYLDEDEAGDMTDPRTGYDIKIIRSGSPSSRSWATAWCCPTRPRRRPTRPASSRCPPRACAIRRSSRTATP